MCSPCCYYFLHLAPPYYQIFPANAGLKEGVRGGRGGGGGGEIRKVLDLVPYYSLFIKNKKEKNLEYC